MILFTNLLIFRSFCLLILWKSLQNQPKPIEPSNDKSHVEEGNRFSSFLFVQLKVLKIKQHKNVLNVKKFLEKSNHTIFNQ